MRSGAVLIGVALLAGCGGSTSIESTGDGGKAGEDAANGGEDAPVCMPPVTIPDANVYQCDAGPPGSVGCQALLGDPSAVYPEGCSLTRSMRGGFCSGPCCGPLQCSCQAFLPGGDASLQFVCPD
jgi:hypothetical protein